MKKYFTNYVMKQINKYYVYDSVKQAEVRYGIETLYITITKTIVIFFLAYLLNIFKELFLLVGFYSLLRITGHGLHAKKSWQCWVSSIISFLIIPFLSKVLVLDVYLKLVISLIMVLLIFIYAPADTEKKPIINKKKRIILKSVCTINALIYTIILIIYKDHMISNILLFAQVTQVILMLPITYRIFNLKYNNYKEYSKTKLTSC